MSLHTGRMGTPPEKVQWYRTSEFVTLLVVAGVLLFVLLVAIWYWVFGPIPVS